MLKWNSTAAKIIVAFSLVALFMIALTEAVMLALVLHNSSETTARQPETIRAEKPVVLPVIPPETYTFHGNGPHGTPHVPFRLYDGYTTA